MQYLDAISKMTMISVHFQGKPFIISVIQVYVPTWNAKVSEVERFHEDLQNLLEVCVKSGNCMKIPVVPASQEFHTLVPDKPQVYMSELHKCSYLCGCSLDFWLLREEWQWLWVFPPLSDVSLLRF